MKIKILHQPPAAVLSRGFCGFDPNEYDAVLIVRDGAHHEAVLDLLDDAFPPQPLETPE